VGVGVGGGGWVGVGVGGGGREVREGKRGEGVDLQGLFTATRRKEEINKTGT